MKKVILLKLFQIFAFTIIFYAVFSCNSKNNYKQIDVLKANTLGFSLNVKSTIPLSNQRGAIIGKITSIKVYNDLVFVLDAHSNEGVSVFKVSGEFLWRTVVGKGPGELIKPIGFALHENEINIIDRNLIVTFDFEGNYLHSRKLPAGFFLRNFEPIYSDKYLTYGASTRIGTYNREDLEDVPIYRYHVVDTSFNQEFSSHSETSLELLPFECDNPYSVLEDQIFLIEKLCNYIYKLENQTFTKSYFINFDSYNFLEKDLKGDIFSVLQLVNSKQRFGLLDDLFQTENFLSFSYLDWNGSPIHVLFSKKHTNCTLWSELLLSHDLPFMEPIGNLNDEFMLIINPADLENNDINKLANRGLIPVNTTVESNPIIAIVEVNFAPRSIPK